MQQSTLMLHRDIGRSRGTKQAYFAAAHNCAGRDSSDGEKSIDPP
jgi:hypothetical protein